MTLRDPIVDDKYRVVAELGRGGMGIVYEAVHLGLGHRVAIKFLSESGVRSDSMLARFAREARAGANIHSEHIARVFDVGLTNDNIPYFVMELLEGDDLANVLVEGKALSVPDAVRFALQACAALAEAHALGIIHRDLKPENIFLQARRGAKPIVKVLDFGLAKIEMNVDAAETGVDLVFGTPKYMAPEQLKSSASAGPEADVWGLGAIIYQMLTGRRAFDGTIMSVVIADVLTKEPTRIRDIRPDVPTPLDAIVMRCLAKDAASRPTAVELAELLAPFGASENEELVSRIKAAETPDRQETTARRVRDFGGRRRARLRRAELAVAITVCIALFFAGLTLSLLRSHRGRAEALPGAALRTMR